MRSKRKYETLRVYWVMEGNNIIVYKAKIFDKRYFTQYFELNSEHRTEILSANTCQLSKGRLEADARYSPNHKDFKCNDTEGAKFVLQNRCNVDRNKATEDLLLSYLLTESEARRAIIDEILADLENLLQKIDI